MVNSSLYSFILGEFSKYDTWSSANYNSLPSHNDIEAILLSLKKWAEANGKIIDDTKIDLRELF